MIFSGLFLLGEIPFTDVIINSTVLAVDGRRMSKSLGTGIDPLEAVAKHGADATRYGLLKISSTQDVRFSWGAIEEGGEAREQALERRAADPPEGRRSRARARPDDARGDLDRRADRRDPRRARGAAAAVRLRARRRRALPPRPSTTSATGTRRRSSRGSTPTTRPRSATALAALERLLALLHPVLPHVTEEIWAQFHETRLILGPWPETGTVDAGRRRGDDARPERRGHVPAQRRARRARGRGEADLRRGREAGAARGGLRRRRRGRARAAAQGDRPLRGACSRTSASSRTRRPRSSRPSARSSSATGASSTRSAADDRRLARGALALAGGVRARADARAARRPRRPAARVPARSTSSARTARPRRR